VSNHPQRDYGTNELHFILCTVIIGIRPRKKLGASIVGSLRGLSRIAGFYRSARSAAPPEISSPSGTGSNLDVCGATEVVPFAQELVVLMRQGGWA
jgi:hypothetical protein